MFYITTPYNPGSKSFGSGLGLFRGNRMLIENYDDNLDECSVAFVGSVVTLSVLKPARLLVN